MTTPTTLETDLTLPEQTGALPFTDERLMEMIQAHTRDGLWLLHERYIALLRQISTAVLHNDSDVQDLLQEVFTEIWKRGDRYEPAKGRPLGWIVTLTRRRAIDRLRKRDAYCRAGDRFAEEMRGANESWTHVHEEVAQHEMSERLACALSDLPEAQRNTVQLAYYQQMSQREIAACTGAPLGTVKTRLELGLRKMAVSLLGYEDLLATGKGTGRTPNQNRKSDRRLRNGVDDSAMNELGRSAVLASDPLRRYIGKVEGSQISPSYAPVLACACANDWITRFKRAGDRLYPT